MKENNKSIKKDFIKELFIALLFSSFALSLLYAFEILTRN